MDVHFNLDSDFEDSKKSKRKKKRGLSGSSFLVVIVMLAVMAYGGWLYWQKQQVVLEMARLKTSISNLETQITESQNDDQKHTFVSPDLTLKAIDERTAWSELILQVKALETGEVSFTHFSVTATGEATISGAARSLTAVKKLLTRLADNPQVIDPFIPNIELADSPGPGLANVEFELLFTFMP